MRVTNAGQWGSNTWITLGSGRVSAFGLEGGLAQFALTLHHHAEHPRSAILVASLPHIGALSSPYDWDKQVKNVMIFKDEKTRAVCSIGSSWGFRAVVEVLYLHSVLVLGAA